jgi:hypothetical protein
LFEQLLLINFKKMAEYFELSCVGTGGNTGAQTCDEDFGRDELFVIVPDTYEIATKTLAETESTWSTLFNAAVASRGYPLFLHFNAEFDNEEPVNEEGWAGKTKRVRDGKKRATYFFKDVSMYNHIELRKHNGRTGLGLFKITANGYIKGWTDDETVFKPFPLNEFRVNDRSDDDGANTDKTSIYIEEQDGKKWNDKGRYVKPTAFDPLLFDGVKDCSVTIASETATSGVATVKGASDQVGVVGLLGTNFRLYADSAPGTPLTVTLGTDNGDGTYDLTWSTISGAHTYL